MEIATAVMHAAGTAFADGLLLRPVHSGTRASVPHGEAPGVDIPAGPLWPMGDAGFGFSTGGGDLAAIGRLEYAAKMVDGTTTLLAEGTCA